LTRVVTVDGNDGGSATQRTGESELEENMENIVFNVA